MFILALIESVLSMGGPSAEPVVSWVCESGVKGRNLVLKHVFGSKNM